MSLHCKLVPVQYREYAFGLLCKSSMYAKISVLKESGTTFLVVKMKPSKTKYSTKPINTIKETSWGDNGVK